MREALLTRTLEHFAAAPFEPQRWNSGLLGLADIGGGSGAQLLGYSPTAGMGFDWMAGIPQEVLDEFEARDGANPRVNPRAVVVNGAALLQPVCDYDLMDEGARSRHPFYQDYLKRVDASFICGGALYRKGDFQVATAVLRSERTGHASAEDVQRISSVFSVVAASVKLHLQLENQGTIAAAGALDALSLAAVFCDPWDEIVACSAAAERFLESSSLLRVRGGRIEARHAETQRQLHAVLRHANGSDPQLRALTFDRSVALNEHGAHLRVAPLPRHNNLFGCGASAVVLIRDGRRTPSIAGLKDQFGFSNSEAEIAALLARGLSLAEIARHRETSKETLRTQLKYIYSKAGVHRQAELVATVSRYTEGTG